MENIEKKLDDAQSKLLKAKESLLSKKGYNEKEVAERLEKEVQMLTKANEVMNQGSDNNVGYDLVPTSVTLNSIVDVMRNKAELSSFLNGLSAGFQGTNLQKNVDAPIVGDIGYARGANERTTGTNQTSQPIRTVATDKVQINQKKLYMSTGVSDYLNNFSVVDVMNIINNKAAQSFAHTIADAVLNGDSTATCTGNINSDDQLATTTFADGALDRRYLFDDGLRKQPINGTLNTDHINVWTLETADFFTLMSKMRADTMPSGMMMIMDNGTYYKAMQLSDFKDMSINGRASTLTTGALTNIAGVDLFVTDLMRKTEADGKLSATAGNNTLGQIILCKRNVIQHGFGQEFVTNIDFNLEKGYLFEASAFFGFANINKKGGETDPSVVAGINVTI